MILAGSRIMAVSTEWRYRRLPDFAHQSLPARCAFKELQIFAFQECFRSFSSGISPMAARR
jgi:hypothetical protein